MDRSERGTSAASVRETSNNEQSSPFRSCLDAGDHPSYLTKLGIITSGTHGDTNATTPSSHRYLSVPAAKLETFSHTDPPLTPRND